jgi:hypothetical protein
MERRAESPGYLPTFEDTENFPYITAVMQEVVEMESIPKNKLTPPSVTNFN